MQHYLKLSQETLYLGISLLDTILDKRDVEADKLQLVGFKLLQGVFFKEVAKCTWRSHLTLLDNVTWSSNEIILINEKPHYQTK